MSGGFERYGVYWVPASSDALARFGARWTGWCAEQGEFRPRFAGSDWGFDLESITRQIRRHGLHGVIRAPFALRQGASVFALEHALGTIAEVGVGFPLPALRLAVVGGRVALAPGAANHAVASLVSDVAKATARLAASETDSRPPPAWCARERRGQVVQLPVADVHRFHVPLTDPLPLDVAFEIMERVRHVLEPMLTQPRFFGEIALVGDPGCDRPLRLLQRYELRLRPIRPATRVLPCRGPHILAREFDQAVHELEMVI